MLQFILVGNICFNAQLLFIYVQNKCIIRQVLGLRQLSLYVLLVLTEMSYFQSLIFISYIYIQKHENSKIRTNSLMRTPSRLIYLEDYGTIYK